MKDAQKPDHVSLNTLIGRMRDGRYVIPDFQREFEWKPWDLRELMRSVFLDYFIGSLLLWRGKPENFEALSCESLYGFEGEGKPEYIVLDGQQRLTALYYAFLAPDKPLPNRASRALYYLRVDRFMREEHDEAFHYEWTSKRLMQLWADREAQYAEHVFPMAVIGAGGWELPNWVQGYERYWRDAYDRARAAGEDEAAQIANVHAQQASEFGDHLRGLTEQYQISYIELDQDLALEKICDIFTQINSRGVRLDIFDLINALLKPKGIKLKHLWRDAQKRLDFVETEKMNVYILQVMSLLRQAYCSPKYLYFLLPGREKPIREVDGTRRREVLIPDIQDFEARWHEAVEALDRAIKLLRHPQEFGAISPTYLPYVSILPVFAALQAALKQRDSGVWLGGQRKIRHWYWASVFTNRYSGSVESTSARDYLDVLAWIDDPAAEPAPIKEFKARFKEIDLWREVRRGTSVYNGVFNLLVVLGARDWITGNVSQHGDLDDHHIVPASWGAKHVAGTQVHSILNRTPLTGETNRRLIGDRLPNQYLPEMIGENGEAQVQAILESHCISPAALAILLRDPFTPDDFEAFLTERQRTIFDAIESLLVKERLDLPPKLRELDAAIEHVELGLRRTVEKGLHGGEVALPQHVEQKVQERLQRAARKNAAFDAPFYETLAGKLEYLDLRELQDAIVSKSSWPAFQSMFGNKESLVGKFDQLAELRNCIRHSRTVDEVTRKEGEAAIVWFEQVLRE